MSNDSTDGSNTALPENLPAPSLYSLTLGLNNVVTGWSYSATPVATDTVVSQEIRDEVVMKGLGLCTWDGTNVAAYLPSPPPPSFTDIDPRQFFQALALQGKISQADCLAYLRTGVLPAQIQAAVSTLSADQQFSALCLLIGAQKYQRSNDLVPLLGAALGMQSANLDALWTAAAAL